MRQRPVAMMFMVLVNHNRTATVCHQISQILMDRIFYTIRIIHKRLNVILPWCHCRQSIQSSGRASPDHRLFSREWRTSCKLNGYRGAHFILWKTLNMTGSKVSKHKNRQIPKKKKSSMVIEQRSNTSSNQFSFTIHPSTSTNIHTHHTHIFFSIELTKKKIRYEWLQCSNA